MKLHKKIEGCSAQLAPAGSYVRNCTDDMRCAGLQMEKETEGTLSPCVCMHACYMQDTTKMALSPLVYLASTAFRRQSFSALFKSRI